MSVYTHSSLSEGRLCVPYLFSEPLVLHSRHTWHVSHKDFWGKWNWVELSASVMEWSVIRNYFQPIATNLITFHSVVPNRFDRSRLNLKTEPVTRETAFLPDSFFFFFPPLVTVPCMFHLSGLLFHWIAQPSSTQTVSWDDQFICKLERIWGKHHASTETVLSWQEAINNKLITPRKIYFSKPRRPFIRASFFIEPGMRNSGFYFCLFSHLALGPDTFTNSLNFLEVTLMVLGRVFHAVLWPAFVCYMLLCLFYRFNSKCLLSTKPGDLCCSRCWDDQRYGPQTLNIKGTA